MSKRLPVPPELEHLIEKRESDEDRRLRELRGQGDRRSEDDLGPLGAIESTNKIEELPSEDRRSHEERRKAKDRRKASRRKNN